LLSRKYQQSPATAPKTWWADYASVPNHLPSNKVISIVSNPQKLLFVQKNCVTFLSWRYWNSGTQ